MTKKMTNGETDVFLLEPLKNRFFRAVNINLSEATSGFDEVAVFSFEKDHLFLGVSIKVELEKLGKKVNCFSFDEGTPLNAVVSAVSGEKCVIAIGGRAAVDAGRLSYPEKLIFMPTSLVYYYAFSPCATLKIGGVPVAKKAPLPNLVIFDVELIKKMKLRHVADSFTIAAASALWAFEEESIRFFSGKDSAAAYALKRAEEELNGLDKNVYGALLRCQAWLAVAVYARPELDFCADRTAAEVLCDKFCDPEEETRFLVSIYVAGLFRTVLKGDIANSVFMPDYNRAALKLCDIAEVDLNSVYEELKPRDRDEYAAALKGISESDLKSLSERIEGALKRYKSAYATVYKGKKKRVERSAKEVVDAIAATACVSKGFIKILADEGVTDVLS